MWSSAGPPPPAAQCHLAAAPTRKFSTSLKLPSSHYSFIHHPQKYPDSSPVSPVFSAAKQWACVFQQFPEVLVHPRLRFCGSSVALMGASLADRRRPLSAALQAETPEYKMSHVVSFPPPPPDAASPHHCRCRCCCLVIYEFPAPSSLLSHDTPPPHPPAT